VADIIEMGRSLTIDHQHRVPYLGFHTDVLSDDPVLSIDGVVCPFYVRLNVQDRAGVLADITRILSQHNISIEAMFQKDVDEGNTVPIMLMTHSVLERNMNAALAEIADLSAVDSDIVRIRVELLQA
jgi:homoserine dehydrogenase